MQGNSSIENIIWYSKSGDEYVDLAESEDSGPFPVNVVTKILIQKRKEVNKPSDDKELDV